MPLSDIPWWRWRARVRSALHMLGDPVFQQHCWAVGADGYGDVTDSVYRLVEDTWLDRWSADRYIGSMLRDATEAALVDTAVRRVLRILHQVGEDAPYAAFAEHHGWPEAVRACRDAHARLAANDGEDPDAPPASLSQLLALTG